MVMVQEEGKIKLAKKDRLRESDSYCENALRIYTEPMPGTTVEESASGMMDISAIYEDVDEPENRSTKMGVMLYMVAMLEDMGRFAELF
ncbi:hypothetical protein IFM89_012422 [Coptis chinensis]|uniref:Uncharacterized protein n=1 Tax=Coptis chinensis TaxID=261450 RepID=A0A835IB20_9MAGN|nr:hypothetical protein IFM89_012422 [Coptis chinensis]